MLQLAGNLLRSGNQPWTLKPSLVNARSAATFAAGGHFHVTGASFGGRPAAFRCV
jgi:hypothetical protein